MAKKKINVVKLAQRNHKEFEHDIFSIPDRGRDQGFEAHYDRERLLAVLKRIAKRPCECGDDPDDCPNTCSSCVASGEPFLQRGR